MKDPAAVELGRRGGEKGGPARAEKLSKRELSRQARKAATARWSMPSVKGRFDEAIVNESGKLKPVHELVRVVQMFRNRIRVFGRRALLYDVGRLWDGDPAVAETNTFRKNVVGVYDERSRADEIVEDVIAVANA